MASYQGQDPEANLVRTSQPEIYANRLNVMQGAFGNLETQITKTLPVAAADRAVALSGRIGYIDSTASVPQFKVGLTAGCLPFLLKPALGYDGTVAEGSVYGDGVLAIPVVACHEVQTTEYATHLYPANKPLTALTSGDNRGKLTPGAYGTDTIVGIVTDGVASVAGKSMLTFITYFLPPTSAGSVVA